MGKKIASLGLTAVLLASGATAAYAGTSYPAEGGVWDRGTNAVWSYSNYFNQNRTHSATVTSNTATATSGWTAPNAWANSRFTARWPGVSYYYNVR